VKYTLRNEDVLCYGRTEFGRIEIHSEEKFIEGKQKLFNRNDNINTGLIIEISHIDRGKDEINS
jgi:hypothetical protein